MTIDSLLTEAKFLLVRGMVSVNCMQYEDACTAYSKACRLLALAIDFETRRVVKQITDPEKNQN